MWDLLKAFGILGFLSVKWIGRFGIVKVWRVLEF